MLPANNLRQASTTLCILCLLKFQKLAEISLGPTGIPTLFGFGPPQVSDLIGPLDSAYLRYIRPLAVVCNRYLGPMQ